jgi:hypothetical protein
VGQKVAPTEVFSRGTLILSVRTEHGVYLASDSRSINAPNPPSNAAQKIFLSGNFAFLALCGVVIARASLPPVQGTQTTATLNLMTALDQISNEYDGSRDVVEYTAARFYSTLEAFWKVYVEPSPEAFLMSQVNSNGIVCFIPVVSRQRGMVEVYEVIFSHSSAGKLLDPVCKKRSEEVIGWGQIPNDAADLPTYSDSAASVLEYIDTMYRHAALFNPQSVGGDTDIGYVDVHRARWIRRKTLL